MNDRQIIIILIVVLAILACSPRSEAALQCNSCHQMPPLDDKIRNSGTGGFRGNHQTHLSPRADIRNCAICHNAVSFDSGHQDRVISFQSNLNQSPAMGRYVVAGKTVTFKNQTTQPILGTCENVNCHFESVTPSWGGTYFRYSSARVNDCGQCHGAPPSGVAPANIGGAAGSHSRHDRFYRGVTSCSLCHPNHLTEKNVFAHATSVGKRPLQVQLHDPHGNAGGSYDGVVDDILPSQKNSFGTCSTVYCHSTVQAADGIGPPSYGEPSWNSDARVCTSCHREGAHAGRAADGSFDVISTGSHRKHLSYQFGLVSDALKCVACHKWDTTKAFNDCSQCHASRYDKHVNGTVDVVFDPSFVSSGRYSDSGVPRNGFGTCADVYCHSDGTAVNTGIATGTATPRWGSSGPLACNACHGYPPSYGNNKPKRNSHLQHASYPCYVCHYETTSDGMTISSTALHVDRRYSVSPERTQPRIFTPNGSGGCLNISCHGGNAAVWGNDLNCPDCHGGMGDAESFAPLAGTPFWSDGQITRKDTMVEWITTGHGRSSSDFPGSGNPAAGFTGPQACEYCHDPSVAHNDTGNPFRLRNQNDPTWGKNGVCMNCHAGIAVGVVIGGIAKKRTTSLAINSYHFGGMHAGNDGGGRFCWDCHDGHGDTNDYMIHSDVAKTSEPTLGMPLTLVKTVFKLSSPPTGSDYAGESNRLCNVCHTRTNHYTATHSDDHYSTTRCTLCHTHNGTEVSTAFR